MTPTSRGVVAGRVVEVRNHPNADRIRIAIVDINAGKPLHIVFGGPPIVTPGCIVPVAPPGSRIGPEKKKMRRRNYRGMFSEGMLCSLAELGWDASGPDEVAILKDVDPGASIDGFAAGKWRTHIKRSHSVANSSAVAATQPSTQRPVLGPFRPAAFFIEEARNQEERVGSYARGGISLVRDA